MKYGHFDLENKEYVITDPATPAPWANYLGEKVTKTKSMGQLFID